MAGALDGKSPKAPTPSSKKSGKESKGKSLDGSPEYDTLPHEELRDHLNSKKASKDFRDTIEDIKKDKREEKEPDLYN